MFQVDHLTSRWKFALGVLVVTCAGCGRDMADQPHYEPLEASAFFANDMASRPLVEGTVARGHLRTDAAYYEGKLDGKPIDVFPMEAVTKKLRLSGSDEELAMKILQHGQQRFDIFCAPCHARTGTGQGMVVQRGFPAPPSYHIERLRAAPVGHFFDVATNGFGRMPDYADQIPTEDRWAIVAYVRALQLSQHAEADLLNAKDRDALQAAEKQP